MTFVTALLLLMTSLALGAEPAAAGNTGTEPNSVAAQAAEIQVTLPLGIGQMAAPLEGLSWIKGSPVGIEAGKAYVIEFWATWCPPCRETIPHLTELQKLYADKITFVGISSETAETVKPFVEKMGAVMDYRVAVDTQGKVAQKYSQAHNLQGIPHAFIIDRKGRIVWYGHPLEGMDQVLTQVAAGTFDFEVYARQKAEAEALEKQLTSWYIQYFEKVQTDGGSPQTDQIAASFIEKAHPEALLAFAWNILIRYKDDPQSIKQALTAAEKANIITAGNEPVVLDTYATALFENGKTSEAVAIEMKALELAGDNVQMQEAFRQRLMEFKSKSYQIKPPHVN
jgi:thiol-disulfide isomerase/thioredoxin